MITERTDTPILVKMPGTIERTDIPVMILVIEDGITYIPVEMLVNLDGITASDDIGYQ